MRADSDERARTRVRAYLMRRMPNVLRERIRREARRRFFMGQAYATMEDVVVEAITVGLSMISRQFPEVDYDDIADEGEEDGLS